MVGLDSNSDLPIRPFAQMAQLLLSFFSTNQARPYQIEPNQNGISTKDQKKRRLRTITKRQATTDNWYIRRHKQDFYTGIGSSEEAVVSWRERERDRTMSAAGIEAAQVSARPASFPNSFNQRLVYEAGLSRPSRCWLHDAPQSNCSAPPSPSPSTSSASNQTVQVNWMLVLLVMPQLHCHQHHQE